MTGYGILEVQRSYTSGSDTITESFLYDFFDSGAHAGRLERVTLRRKVNAGAWQDVLKAEYTYYGSSSDFGSLNDLETVTRYEWDGSAWDQLDVNYYRYWKQGEPNGFEHGLQYVVGPGAYQNMLDAGLNPLTVSDAQIAVYADNYFEYNADEYDNLIWHKDERGFITLYKYDIETGAMTQQIDNVDTAQVSDEPTGWSTPTGGGLHLVTDYEHDDQVWTGRGFQKVSDSSFTLVNPVGITITDKNGNVTDEVQATRSSTSGKLLPTDSFPQSSYVRWTTHQYTDCCKLISTRVYHTIPASGTGSSGTNYDQTDFGYDSMDRQNRVTTPGGTITFSVFDVRDLPASIWVGTNDNGATDSDPTGGGVPGNNVVIVTQNEYDRGNDGGDGNLTQQTQHVDGSTTRVTSFGYDWRDRQTSIDGEIDFYQKTYYDNLDRVTKVERYDTTAAGNLIGRQDTKFDDLDRVYETVTYGVNPSNGSVGNSLTDKTWYDAAGNIMKQAPSGSKLFTKLVYDGLNRETKQYVGFDTDETTYADAGTITGDTIFEQAETTYDAASNVIQVTARQRYHNATGTGELGTPVVTFPVRPEKLPGRNHVVSCFDDFVLRPYDMCGEVFVKFAASVVAVPDFYVVNVVSVGLFIFIELPLNCADECIR